MLQYISVAEHAVFCHGINWVAIYAQKQRRWPKNCTMTMRGGRRFASCLFVTYHGFAAQGEHIGRAALQGSRPNIHLRNEWQINFFMRWWLWRKGLPPCRPLPSEKFCRARGARKQNYNLRPPLPLMLPPRNALQKMLPQIFEMLTTDESFTRGEVCQQEGCISEDLPRAVVVLQDKDSLAQYPW